MRMFRTLIENPRHALPAAALALLCVIAGLVASDLAESAQEPPESRTEFRAEIRTESRPVQSRTTEEAPPLCRFGVNASDDIGAYDTSPLRLGWYVNFRATAAGAGPAGADF